MKVPLIDTTIGNEFGDLKETAAFNDSTGMDRDSTFVPGFSNLRRERDLAIAEVAAGKRHAKDVPTMPFNLRWARNQRQDGKPDSSKVFAHNTKGYEQISREKHVGHGKIIPSLPPGAVEGQDGTIRNGDTVLMIATKEAAAKNETVKQRMTLER